MGVAICSWPAFEGAWGDWAVEIKTGDWNGRDLAGVLEFCARQPRFRPLLLTGAASVARAREFGVVAQDWREFLRSGPPAAAR